MLCQSLFICRNCGVTYCKGMFMLLVWYYSPKKQTRLDAIGDFEMDLKNLESYLFLLVLFVIAMVLC